jgi:hypothetical protein
MFLPARRERRAAIFSVYVSNLGTFTESQCGVYLPFTLVGKTRYRGDIWVDATDFAVTKIEAEPAKRPSIWISKTVVHHTYRKLGEFWLPAQNESNTDVRLEAMQHCLFTTGITKSSPKQNLPAQVLLPTKGDKPQ